MDNLWNIFEVIKSIAGFLAVFGITFELLPVKISPLKWLGNRLNRDTNARIDKIQKQVDGIEYDNAMRDLRSIKSRIHSYGMLIRKGEKLEENVLKNAIDDLDVYDFYKEKYKYMYINGVKVKINGEMKMDRKLIEDQLYSINKGD